MIRSMTAFARLSGLNGKGQWVIEIRSVNHRYFDCSLRLPPDYYEYEGQVRESVRSQISRGKVSVSITKLNEEEAEQFNLDEKAVKKYLQAIRKIKSRFSIPGDITIRELILLPQLFEFKKGKESLQKGWISLQKVLKLATGKMVAAKQKEGGKIAADMAKRLQLIERSVKRIEVQTRQQSKHHYEKLKTRIQELLGETKIDEEKLWKEMAVLADRSDITEEIVRINSHLKLFSGYLKTDREIGREMDFLCQEMHREVNTMGSKSQFFDISREVVFLKGEIEKIREQVQNVE